MRALLITAGFLLASAAHAQDPVQRPAAGDTTYGADATAHAHHARTFSMVSFDLEAGESDGETLFASEGDAWIGGDRNKLWFKSEVEVIGGEAERAELQALYSRNLSTFFDAQAGVRYDAEPDGRAYLTAGVKGLAPYLFETDAQVFLSEDGDVSFRLEQGFELLLTQRLVLEPEFETELQLDDVPGLDLGAGFTDVEASLQLRYEITRKFAPYVELNYERLLGETASIARREGGHDEETTLRAGVRVWF